MDNILKEIGLEHLSSQFRDEKIEIQTIKAMSDEQLIDIGVKTLGDRLRLREKCSHNPQPSCSAGAALSERLNLFNPRSRRQTLHSSSRRSAKGKAVKRPWTVNFVCLADRHQSRVPTAKEKLNLAPAGLGLKKIKLDMGDSEEDVYNKITSDEKGEDGDPTGFPQLKDCGGFELLYCGLNSKDLCPVTCCWAAKDLKASIGSQSKMYLRPIQKGLSTNSLMPTKKSEFTEKCLTCGKSFLMSELRMHILSCNFSSDDEYTETMELTSSASGSLPAKHESPELTSETPADAVNSNMTADVVDGHQPDISQPSTSAGSSNIICIEDESVPQPVVSEIDLIVEKVVEYCNVNAIKNPVEVLRCLQNEVVTGRPLEIESHGDCINGETNLIMVDRGNLLETAFDEVKELTNLRLTLEVEFYGEKAKDFGGPRKEFFSLALAAIKEKYFDHGLRQHLADDYVMVGIVLGLSILQNGRLPKFLKEETLTEIFETGNPTAAVIKLRIGLKKLGIYQICQLTPLFVHLFRPSEAAALTLKKLTNLLKPTFSEEGGNNRTLENEVFSSFRRYLREVAGGRRGGVSLAHILRFTTGTEEEPLLGFGLHPSIAFSEVCSSFLPTANTCSNTLSLPRASIGTPLPKDERLFELYDCAFLSQYFGNI